MEWGVANDGPFYGVDAQTVAVQQCGLYPKAHEAAAAEYARHHSDGKPHGFCLDSAITTYLSHAAGDVAGLVATLERLASDTGTDWRTGNNFILGDHEAVIRSITEAATALLALSARVEAAEAREAKGAIADIATERRRQIEAEGWTPENDDAYQAGDLAAAAACYAIRNAACWPWAMSWWKPTDRRRDLVKAGALIIAEIERLDRLAARSLSIKEGCRG